MGTTREEARIPELRNRTRFLTKDKMIFYPSLILATILGLSIGGNIEKQTSVHNTLKLCNQKPLECKFKYDVLMYEQTGKIPYTAPVKK